MSSKLSKHPRYDDPSAFAKGMNFAKIVPTEEPLHPMRGLYKTAKFYKMGKLGIITHNDGKYFLSVQGKDCYPTWDEVVWIRYNLIPDAAIMAMLLPNLNSYINQEDSHYKFVFAMEQTGWALDPIPTCGHCEITMKYKSQSIMGMQFECEQCQAHEIVDPNDWNEQHGNGRLAKR